MIRGLPQRPLGLHHEIRLEPPQRLDPAAGRVLDSIWSASVARPVRLERDRRLEPGSLATPDNHLEGLPRPAIVY